MLRLTAMRTVAVMLVGLAGACSSAQMPDPSDTDAPGRPDAGTDASAGDGPGSPDAAAPDGPTPDAATDAPLPIDAPTDAGIDAPPCLISAGDTITLDGTGDLAEYPASQRLTPGAPLAGSDEVGLTWDPTYLYLTVTSESFLDASRPVHLYLEAKPALAGAGASQGKEYGGLTAELPFMPNFAIALRRTNDFGSGGYDGVYIPGGAAQPWTVMHHPLVPGTDVFASSDNRTLSVRTPWSALGGCPLQMRAVLHVVHGAAANEWKDLLPAAHTPWLAPGGAYYEISLDGDPATSGWAQH